MKIARYAPGAIVDDVVRLSEADYQAGIDEFVERFGREFPFPVAFYQYGQVSSPGVSDLDLVVVCRNEDWNRAWHLTRQVCGVSDRMRYLFTHLPDVVCEPIFPCLEILKGQPIDRLKPIARAWEPEVDRRNLPMDSDDMFFMRFVVWNSRARVDWARSAGARTASLRRILVLVKNLIAESQIGNSLLTEPLEVDFDACDIRNSVLNCEPADRFELCRDYMDQTFAKLNEVDTALDRELAVPVQTPVVFQPGAACRCVAPLSASIHVRSTALAAACPGGLVITVPRYLVEAGAVIARYASATIPALRPMLPVEDGYMRRYPGAWPFAESLASVSRLCAEHGVPFVGWPTPFGMRVRRSMPAQFVRLARRVVGAAAFRVSAAD